MDVKIYICSPIPSKRLHAGVAEECRRVSLGPATAVAAIS
jgi:hypothetical protein